MTRTDNSVVPDYREWMSLRGRAVIVLGSGQGIGRQAAHAARGAGADVFCVDRDADLARDVATEVRGVPWTADVSRRVDVEGTFAAAQEALGRVDGVVDVVGLVRWASIDDIDDKSWNLQFDVGLRQALYVLQIGSPYVERSGGGSMVFVASVSGLYGAPQHAAYGAAKAGLMALVKSAAVEYAPRRIRVNAVAPGTTASPPVLARMSVEERAVQSAAVPLGRIAESADIAAGLLFFLTDLSRHVTGQTLIVDGGVSALFPHGRRSDPTNVPEESKRK
jgi:NAD(P)-dependent dehydrogenase (short-subunit alcohol dehydrogenase family)